MSMESAKAFMDRMKNDEDFQKKVHECKGIEDRKALVKKVGFNFSVEELKAAVSGELSNEELEALSAGSNSSLLYSWYFAEG